MNDGIFERAARDLAVADTAVPSSLSDYESVAHPCPVCAYQGRLFGRITVEVDAESEYEDGEIVWHGFWRVLHQPRAFLCNVCALLLNGPEQLVAAGLASEEREVDEIDLGEGVATAGRRCAGRVRSPMGPASEPWPGHRQGSGGQTARPAAGTPISVRG